MKPLLTIATLLACVSFATDSKAQNYGNNGLPYHGFGYSGSLYGLGYIPVPPYFAIHPPVYYSHQIARPYGHSPFAYAPQRPVPQPRRQIVLNPHVPEPLQTSQTPEAKVAAKSINNPFYDASNQLASIPELQLNPTYAAKANLANAD